MFLTTMVDVKACRICLVVNVPLYYLLSEPLELYIHTIMGEGILTNGLPPYACSVCVTLINKYYSFRERCFRGQNLLYDILSTDGSVSTESIAKVDRETVALTFCIKTPIEDSVVDFIHEDEVEVKHEPKGMDIKMEIDSKSQLSSDDEPLSKSCNSKKAVKKKIKKKNDKKKEFNITEEIPKTKADNVIELKSYKNCRTSGVNNKQRPRRTPNTRGVNLGDDNVEEYAIVIPLTLQEQMEEIEKRKTSINYLNSVLKCNLCYKGYIDSVAWNKHVIKHQPVSGAYECAICKFRFKEKRSLQMHITTHDTRYQCKDCSFVSITKTQAKLHHRWHKGVTYSCEHCSEVFNKWTSYMSHVRLKHPSEHICGICGYSFVSAFGLKQHKTKMHKPETTVDDKTEAVKVDGDLYCALCDIKFENHEAWKRHVVMSTKHSNSDLPVGCRECGGWFRSMKELYAHHREERQRIRAANDTREWPAPCEICSEVFENANDYSTHFRRNHPAKSDIKNLVCDVCGKRFRGNASLVIHKRIHSGERPFKCGQCPKTFNSKRNLQFHERSHSDVRPFPCTLCTKGFKFKGALVRHFRSHTGEKPFVCEVCGKAFSQSESRKLHIRTVHMKLPAPYIRKSRQKKKKEMKLT